MTTTMPALQFELSIPRYLLGKAASWCCPHRFFPATSCLHYRPAIDVPQLPGPDWALIKMEACGICGSDLNALRGVESFSMEPYASFPAVMGHEIVGRIAEVGSAVTAQAEHLVPGTRVAVENILPCAPRGITPACEFCARGDYALCVNYTRGCLPPGVCLGFTKGLGGGFSSYVVAHRSQLFALPEQLPLTHAVLIDSLASAMQPVAQHLPNNEQTVIVYGAGIIGLNTVQCLRAAGFMGQLLVIARHCFQGEWAKTLGATDVLAGDPFTQIAERTGAWIYKPTLGPRVLEGGVDCVFDCVGSASTIDHALRFVRKRGKVVLVGTAGQIAKIDASPLWFKEVTLTGSAMFSHSVVQGKRQRTYQHVIDLLASGALHAEGLVTHQFTLSQYAQAFQVALDKTRHHSLKVAFTHV